MSSEEQFTHMIVDFQMLMLRSLTPGVSVIDSYNRINLVGICQRQWGQAVISKYFFSLIFLFILDNSTVLHEPPLARVRSPGTKEDNHAPPDGCSHHGIGMPYILIKQYRVSCTRD
jgi:hypothetical protein